MTQVQIATRMRVSKQAVSNLESQTGNPSIHTVERYARALGLKLVIVERS